MQGEVAVSAPGSAQYLAKVQAEAWEGIGAEQRGGRWQPHHRGPCTAKGLGIYPEEIGEPGRALCERTGMRCTNWKDQAAAWRLDCGGWEGGSGVSLQAERGKQGSLGVTVERRD